MALFPNLAEQKLLTENSTQGRIDPTQIILHTAVDAPGPSDLYLYFEKASNHESHFFIKNDGTIVQYMDTNVRADANASANIRAVSIETEDDGKVAAWTVAQVNSIKRLGAALMQAHPKIARRVCSAHDQPGWGYHVMFGAPGPWTPVVGKACPGGPRIHQFNTDITMWLRSGQNLPEDDMTPSEHKMLSETNHRVARIVVPAVQDLQADMNRVMVQLAALTAKVESQDGT